MITFLSVGGRGYIADLAKILPVALQGLCDSGGLGLSWLVWVVGGCSARLELWVPHCGWQR